MQIKSINKKYPYEIKDVALIFYGVVLLLGTIILDRYSAYVLLGGIIFPIVLYIAVSNFKYLILSYIVLIPFIQHFSYYAIKAGEFFVTPHMIIQFIILLAVFFSFLSTYKFNRNELKFLDKLIILLAISTIFSLIYPYTLPIDHTKRWLLFYTGIFENTTFYFIILYMLRNEKDFTDKLIIAISLSVLSASIIAFMEIKSLNFNLINLFLARMHIGFGFHNTNLFGLYSALIFPLYFFVLTNKKFSHLKIPLVISFVILSILSILCFNRGTFLIIVIQLFLLYRMKNNRKIIYVFVLACIVMAVYYNEILLLYIQKFLAGKNEATTSAYLDYSALYRLEGWKLGSQLLFVYPLGLGGGGFLYAWEKFGPAPSFFLPSPHQLFLSVGVSYGVLSMIIFIIILITSYSYCNKMAKSQHDAPNVFNYLKISIIGFVGYGVTTGGELSHLTGFITPNNGYTLLLFTLIAVISYHRVMFSSGNERMDN